MTSQTYDVIETNSDKTKGVRFKARDSFGRNIVINHYIPADSSKGDQYRWCVNTDHCGDICLAHIGSHPQTRFFFGKVIRDTANGRPTFVCHDPKMQAFLDALILRKIERAANRKRNSKGAKAAPEGKTDLVSTIIKLAAPEAPKAIVEAVPADTVIATSPVVQFAMVRKAQTNYGVNAEFNGTDYPVTYVSDTNQGMIDFNGLPLMGNVVDGKFVASGLVSA